MKLIGITQRVAFAPKYGERRDVLDQRWASFLHRCGYLPYPIPNHVDLLSFILKLPLVGIVLTGGNTLNSDAPERDQVEKKILEHALTNRLPLLGVCRGMQLILGHFGSSLEKIQGHVGTLHTVNLKTEKTQKNSYHKYGAFEVRPPLTVLGIAEDGVIEAVKHAHLPIFGIMWHPERNHPFIDSDIRLLRKIFCMQTSEIQGYNKILCYPIL